MIVTVIVIIAVVVVTIVAVVVVDLEFSILVNQAKAFEASNCCNQVLFVDLAGQSDGLAKYVVACCTVAPVQVLLLFHLSVTDASHVDNHRIRTELQLVAAVGQISEVVEDVSVEVRTFNCSNEGSAQALTNVFTAVDNHFRASRFVTFAFQRSVNFFSLQILSSALGAHAQLFRGFNFFFRVGGEFKLLVASLAQANFVVFVHVVNVVDNAFLSCRCRADFRIGVASLCKQCRESFLRNAFDDEVGAVVVGVSVVSHDKCSPFRTEKVINFDDFLEYKN